MKTLQIEDCQTSTMPTYCSCKLFNRTLAPLQLTRTISFDSSSAPPSPTGRRRFRRILYPASQSRRPRLKEAPDQACRWLVLLSALVFLQIYTEEVHPCTELQSQSPDVPVSTQLQEGEESLCMSQRWTGDNWSVHIAVRSSEAQQKCEVL